MQLGTCQLSRNHMAHHAVKLSNEALRSAALYLSYGTMVHGVTLCQQHHIGEQGPHACRWLMQTCHDGSALFAKLMQVLYDHQCCVTVQAGCGLIQEQ